MINATNSELLVLRWQAAIAPLNHTSEIESMKPMGLVKTSQVSALR